MRPRAGTLYRVRVFEGLAKLFVACVMAGVLLAGVLLPYALGVGLGANKVADAVNTADTQLMDMSKVPLRTTITDSDGDPIAYIYEQNREYVPLSQISLYLQWAVTAVEDRRFLLHHGVDWQGTLRAILKTASQEQVQGGSTLTQQLVKNYLYLVNAKTPAEKADAIAVTPIRKLREAKIALQYESGHTKKEILEQYLNLVAFGPSTYGAQAASEHFFGVDADRLSLSQAALLGAMINNPNTYNPLSPGAIGDAQERRNLVLDAMARDQYISQKEAEKAKQVSVAQDLNATWLPNGCIAAPNHAEIGYFCRYVLDYLQNAGIDYDDIARGGYTITTTLDDEAMKNAVAAVTGSVNPDDADAARVANVMAVVEPGVATRKVLALASNRPYGLDQSKGQTVQRLTTTFAPLGAGGVFKVFTAAAAMDRGLGTQAMIPVPKNYTSDLVPSYQFYNRGSYPDATTLQAALNTQPNTPFVALEDQLGLPAVVSMAVDLGLRGYTLDAGEVDRAFSGLGTTYAELVPAQRIASFTLGVSPVSPLELANVGATLDSDGVWCPPTPIMSIADRDGTQISWNEAPCEQAVVPELAHTLTNALVPTMRDQGGTGYDAAQEAGWSRVTAGISGTTLQYKSGAFLGYTPYYSAAVMTWDYQPSPQPICVEPVRSCTWSEASGASGGDPDDAGGAEDSTDGDSAADDSDAADDAAIDPGTGAGMAGNTIPLQTWLTAMIPLHKGLPDSQFGPSTPDYLGGNEETQIPDTTGMLLKEARVLLENRGFTNVNIEFNAQSPLPANVVESQDPVQGALPGASVTLIVSSNPTASSNDGDDLGTIDDGETDDGGWQGGDDGSGAQGDIGGG